MSGPAVKGVVCLLLVLLAGQVGAQSTLPDSPLPAELVLARDIHFSSQTGRVEDALKALDSLERKDGTDIRILCEILFYRGLLLLDLERGDEASMAFQQGIEVCRKEFESEGDLFYLVQEALLKSQWMMLQKTSVLIRTGSEIRKTSERALDEDPGNFTARLLSAQGLINAPPLFGGNPVEAVEILEDTIPLAEDEYELFTLYLSLADARRKKKAWDEAGQWVRRALALFPENRNALEMGDAIRRREK
ncbi:MAG: hypothetical protein PQJ50_08035 [Spirochaetales bacterium]|nr:hypothetical protein [Spirochaetales bacterium]